MRILISTGEVSGDVVGARLTRAITAERPDAEVLAIGGARMEEAGALVRFKSSHLGTVGITEAFRTVPAFARVGATVGAIVRDERPAVAVLIGNDVFHVLLGRWLRSRGVATVAYFPPQIWVWRSLAGPIARSFDAVLTSFPEEQTVYQRASRMTRVNFVGHYLSDVLTWRTADAIHAARARLGIDAGVRVVGLMPGSRRHEIRTLLPELTRAAKLLLDDRPALRFVLPVAEPRYYAHIVREIAQVGISTQVTLVEGPNHDAMIAADLLILASGTASLEAALVGTPLVIVYKVSRATYGIVRACIRLGLIDSDTVGLPNLILGRRAIPELIQHRADAPRIAQAAAAILSSREREREILEALAEASRHLSGGDAIGRVASFVLEMADARTAEVSARAAVPDAIAASSRLDASVAESE